MLAIVPMLDKIPVFFVFVLSVTLFSPSQGHRNGERRLTSHKLDSVIEKYMRAVKRLTDEFPNHQIELHLDVAGEDTQRPPRRVNYIHLRDPARLIGRAEDKNKTETISKLAKPLSLSSVDPEMQPVLMKDLNKAMKELDRKYSGQIVPGSIDHRPRSNVDDNMKPILQLLGKGTLVNREVLKPPEENMSWLQIKIPKLNL